MIDYFRSLFGLNKTSGRRVVLGQKLDLDAREGQYVRDSNARLLSLHHLYSRYQNTAHAAKIKAVYDKTKAIQDFMISKGRIHELELFHIQHTEHFINTFSAIIEVYQPEDTGKEVSLQSSSSADTFLGKLKQQKVLQKKEEMKESPVLQARNGQNTTREGGEESIFLPTISINTFEKIPYFPEGLPAKAIGYTSTTLEKEDFLRHISFILGLSFDQITYMGNARVNIRDTTASGKNSLLPVIHWKGSLYVVQLNESRLFPVKTFRRGL